MRLKEMTQMKWAEVNLDQRIVTIPPNSRERRTKTGGRDVPLSTRAIQIIKEMEPLKDESDRVFHLSENQVDALFRKIRDKALIEDLHFHDSKHEACTRLAKKVNVFDLARIVGTRDLKTLMIYYNKSAADIAADLD